MPFHAHTSKLSDGKTTNPDSSSWEPLFTSFGKGENNCQRETCQSCADLQPQHGHLNKVAYHTAKFAAEMFPDNSEESKSAHQWGYLTVLWHDLGKFAPEWQTYLASKADPHTAEITGKVDHSSAGAQFSKEHLPLYGTLLSYLIAGHHAFKHDSQLGNAPSHKLFELVTVAKKDGVEVPRAFADYKLKIDRDSLPKVVEIIERI